MTERNINFSDNKGLYSFGHSQSLSIEHVEKRPPLKTESLPSLALKLCSKEKLGTHDTLQSSQINTDKADELAFAASICANERDVASKPHCFRYIGLYDTMKAESLIQMKDSRNSTAINRNIDSPMSSGNTSKTRVQMIEKHLSLEHKEDNKADQRIRSDCKDTSLFLGKIQDLICRFSPTCL